MEIIQKIECRDVQKHILSFLDSLGIFYDIAILSYLVSRINNSKAIDELVRFEIIKTGLYRHLDIQIYTAEIGMWSNFSRRNIFEAGENPQLTQIRDVLHSKISSVNLKLTHFYSMANDDEVMLKIMLTEMAIVCGKLPMWIQNTAYPRKSLLGMAWMMSDQTSFTTMVDSMCSCERCTLHRAAKKRKEF